jgi:hypothetical protein
MKTETKLKCQVPASSFDFFKGAFSQSSGNSAIKKLGILICLLTIFTSFSYAQSRKFDGYWFGTITTSGDREVEIILKVENNIAHQMVYSESEGLKMYNWPRESTQYLRNNLSYTWLNMGGVWTETQTFMLSYLNDDELQALWIRQVNNLKEDVDNEEWFVTGRGIMRRLSNDEVALLNAN